jgi:hypothetical protein
LLLFSVAVFLPFRVVLYMFLVINSGTTELFVAQWLPHKLPDVTLSMVRFAHITFFFHVILTMNSDCFFVRGVALTDWSL